MANHTLLKAKHSRNLIFMETAPVLFDKNVQICFLIIIRSVLPSFSRTFTLIVNHYSDLVIKYGRNLLFINSWKILIKIYAKGFLTVTIIVLFLICMKNYHCWLFTHCLGRKYSSQAGLHSYLLIFWLNYEFLKE